MKTIKLPNILPRTAALAALLLAGGLIDSSAATDKSGVIAGETWTPSMSPIRVVGDITVANLTIQPGVEVLFTGNFEFDCPGVLTAAGNAANKIWFHGDTGITWKGLNFLNSANGSVLDHCIVENSNDHGIAITNSGPVVRNCEIKNNTTGAKGGGVYILINVVGTPMPSIENSEISINTATGGGGAGLYYELSIPGTAIFSDCVFENNNSTPYGAGGIYLKTGSVTANIRLIDCAINNNTSTRTNTDCSGAGAYLEGNGNVEMLRCTVQGNQASVIDTSIASFNVKAGGIYLINGGSLIMRNCMLNDNRAQSSGSSNGTRAWGGCLYIESGSALLFNCLISNNIASGGGGSYGAGIGMAGGALTVENSTVINNNVAGFHISAGTTTIRNSIIFFNNANGVQIANGGTTTVTYSDVQNGYAGTGNISTSPLLNPDYTLNSYSPCKDAGDPAPAYNDLVFYNATTAPWGSLGTARNDMGAYGGPGAALWEPGSGPPKIESQSGGGLYGVADAIQLSAGVSGLGPFTYVWKKDGVPLTNSPPHITGATTGTLTITDAVLGDGGIYTVEVTSPYGGPATKSFIIAVDPLRVNVKMFAGVIVQATPGTTVRVEYSNDLSPGSWNTLSQFAVPTSPYTYYDTASPNHARRFYRAIEVP